MVAQRVNDERNQRAESYKEKKVPPHIDTSRVAVRI